ncbi:hypothetical protein LguiA_033838 [Lonicera macranthoides]
MAVNLTDGAIALLSSGEATNTDVKPVLQVVDIRAVNTSNHQNNSNERFRLLLSDGSYLQQGMLATQRNDLVRSERLQKGSVVQLTQFVCNIIQKRMIIIIIDLDVILDKCEPIGEPKQYPTKNDNETPPPLARSSPQVQPSMNQPSMVPINPQSFGGTPVSGGSMAKPVPANPQSFGASPLSGGSMPRPTVGCGTNFHPPEMDRGAGSYPYTSSYNSANTFPRTESGAGISRFPSNNNVTNNVRPPQPAYNQPPPMYSNRGPIAKNEAPPRVIPIAALNPYQGRWTIRARVTVKSDLRHYNNPRGDGKVFSFDLLDADGGEIRVTCFNAVADQFYNQIEVGKVYIISKGSLKPAQKAYNHLNNEHEIMLDSTSTVQPCFDDDRSIPQQQFRFRPISEIEGMENNSVADVIGVVSSISPSSSIMRKNGTETQRRVLQLKDMSGRSVELTLWGNFCNSEGQTIQHVCDSGEFPIVAVKTGRVNDFNGKALGTISTSQLFINPDFPEAHKLKIWFEQEGKNTPSLSISRETTAVGRTDVRKTISQIKDERLGTSEKPDWITVSATLSFVKVDNFCYTACPIMTGERQCNKKVTNNGDGKWRCDKCDQLVDQCDYRYILQLQIQDHTGLTWVTAFQECGEEIIGKSAKELYSLKYEEQDDERFGEIIRNVLFTKYIFKLKVKEEMFSDEQRVKSTVVKAEKVNFTNETKFLLGTLDKLKGGEDSSLVAPKVESVISNSAPGPNITGFGNVGFGETASPVVSSMRNSGTAGQGIGAPASQAGQYGNNYSGSRFAATGSTGAYLSCNSCGGTGHSSMNCPSVMSGQGHSYGGGFDNRGFSRGGGGGTGGSGGGGGPNDCFKCGQVGHWARDCPGVSNVPPAYGSGSVGPGRYGNVPRQHVGGF